jgi:hypothetical protein
LPDLATTQRLVAAALADVAPDDEAIALIAGAPAHARRRLAIYRANVAANAVRALAAAYPIVCKLVGAEFFDGLARAYCREYPSDSGDLNRLGGQFADFVRAFPHTRSLPYLPDVARLEWLAHLAYYAADHAPADVSSLALIREDDYPRLALTLHPAVCILASNYPIFRIWEVHQDDYRGEIAVDLDSGAEQVVVYRPQFRASVALLSGAESAFLDAIMQGRLLGNALEQASAKDCGFDLAASLQRWVAANIVVDLRAVA